MLKSYFLVFVLTGVSENSNDNAVSMEKIQSRL